MTRTYQDSPVFSDSSYIYTNRKGANFFFMLSLAVTHSPTRDREGKEKFHSKSMNGGGGGFKYAVLISLGFLMCFLISSSSSSSSHEKGESSSTCLMVYKEGGAPAVFQSPKCPHWNISSTVTSGRRRRWTENCQSSKIQGRRKYQEDRTFCTLDLLVPFPARTGTKEVKVGIVAIFDGHRGAEASDMASRLLLEYFLMHVSFLLDGKASAALGKSIGQLSYDEEMNTLYEVLNQDKQNCHSLEIQRSSRMLSEIFDGSFQMEILKESLLRAINDINATFLKEAFANNLHSGTTATIVLIVDGQILVANVGDSKALLCSERVPSSQEVKETLLSFRRHRRLNGAKSPAKETQNFKKVVTSAGSDRFFVKELTSDHHPDRDDERLRVEAAGGYVVEWNGVPRVNGELAVTRSIGDVSFKSYGVISMPEVTDWQHLSVNDSYLVAASDGVFEKMTTQDICDLIWEWDVHNMQGYQKPELFSSCTKYSSLADCIVNSSFEKGSMDNMAAIVVPLRSTGFSKTLGRIS